ncbi:MAG: MerR family transcriptional regulator [Actinobacteria bacterium]|nr:MerR family transcriptional regulator [Actinomycetota bacterium]MCL6104429.1 MerR family transcriptional regulator [Actinomycetota bacterium]
MNNTLFSIGEAAKQIGVSTRTLRYYEEMELLAPCSHTAGGTRRYSSEEIARCQHIRNLHTMLGLHLDEIKTMLQIEDQLEKIKTAYKTGTKLKNNAIAEALELNLTQRNLIKDKISHLQTFLDELEEKAKLWQSKISKTSPNDVKKK